MKKIIVFTTIIFAFITIQCYGAEYVKGAIVSNLQNKLKIVYGDQAVINLGTNNGIIKGDILNIARSEDTSLANPIGRCAVIKTFESTSICEILNMKQEIESQNVVYMSKLQYNDAKLFPDIRRLLNNIVDPYEPQKEISIYIYNFLDENKNITQFSELLKKEMKFVFSQKKRIKLVSEEVGKIFAAYHPNEISDKNKVVEGYMKKDDIDVLIAGTYEIQGEKTLIKLFKVDNNWDVVRFQGTFNTALYGEMLTNVTAPYVPIKKEQNIICNFLYDPVRTIPTKDEKVDFILSASKNDPFLQYSLNKVDFNIIGPVEFKLKIDKDTLDFDKQKKYQLLLSTGKHEITASYKKGLYSNDVLMFTLPEEYTKTVLLQIDKGDELNVEIIADPLYGKQLIVFKVYTKVLTSQPILKPVIRIEQAKPVEMFKD